MITTPVSDYAAAVRAALADVPEPDRSELLEDLEDHLAEVAGESDEPLESRLGTPEAYAAELHAAYLQRPGQPASKKRSGPVRRLDARIAAFHARMGERLPWYETLRNDFRPAWWLFRGYLIAFVLWSMVGGGFSPIPSHAIDLLILIGAVTASVVLGYRMRDGRRSATLLLVSLGASLFAGFVIFALGVEGNDGFDSGPSYEPSTADYLPYPDLANIYPYTKDGKPLKDVLLYDQNGRPLQIDPESHGFRPIPGPTPQIPNSYPLSICEPVTDVYQEEAVFVPTCPATAEALPPASPAPLPSDLPAPPAEPDPTPAEPDPTSTATSSSSPGTAPASPSTSPTSPESSPAP